MSHSLKLMPEYGGDVIWSTDANDAGPVDIELLPIPEKLRQALKDWAEKFDATLNPDDPLGSGFESDSMEREFEAEGLRLWEELRHALGSEWTVSYFSWSDGRLISP